MRRSAGSWLFLSIACLVSTACQVISGLWSIDQNTGGASSGSTGSETTTSSGGGSGSVAVVSSSSGSAGGGGPCDPSAPFGMPVPIDELNGDAQNTAARLTQNELVVFFAQGPAGVPSDLFHAERASKADPFSKLTPIAGLNTVAVEGKPSATADLARLYFHRNLLPTAGSSYDIQVSFRDPGLSEYVTATPLGPPVNDGNHWNQDPFVSPDGAELYFTSSRGTGFNTPEIFLATGLDAMSGSFSSVTKVAAGTQGVFNDSPVVSADGLTLYFGSGTGTETTVYVAHRPTKQDPYVLLGSHAELLMTNARTEPSWISPDQCTLYLFSNRTLGLQIFRASR